ncbi:MAG: amidase [Verrucomicrobiota bacterium]
MNRCHPRSAKIALSGLLLATLLGGCSLPPEQRKSTRNHGFIRYWPPPEGSGGLRLAVKDNIDMKGYVTSAGSEFLALNTPPAKRDAPCLAIARERNVQIVGKTTLTEFAVTVSGRNTYFGTPVNRWDGKHKAIPGGSSSGSAVAVSSGWADVAFGSDTGGSIRVPAACCGIYGLKTTFGLVSTKGVFPISPKHLDTVGPMAADIPHLVEGMDLLKRGFRSEYQQAVAAKPSARQIRIGRLYIAGTDPQIDKAIDEALTAKGFKVVKLDDRFKDKWEKAEADGRTIALGDAWLNDEKYTNTSQIDSTTRLVIGRGGIAHSLGYKDAVKRKAAWQRELRRVFQKVDFIATPTLKTLPPKFPWFGSAIVFEWLVFESQNTVGVNFAGNPALAIPIDLPPEGKVTPVTSLQLVGPRLSEAELLNAGRIISSKP